jgi:hypothetical protein
MLNTCKYETHFRDRKRPECCVCINLMVERFRNRGDQSLMFIPCTIRRIRKDQQHALICTTLLFYVLASTCFGSSLPSSGSFLDPPEVPEIQIEWVEYHIMCGYVTCVPNWNPIHTTRRRVKTTEGEYNVQIMSYSSRILSRKDIKK